MPKKSKPRNSQDISEKIFAIIDKIPHGKVLTYGQVATLVGIPRAARMVGRVLFQKGLKKKIPWQRVINAQGKVSTYRVGMGEEQVRLLKKEGIQFSSSEALDLKKYQWWPKTSQLAHLALDEETAWRISERLGF